MKARVRILGPLLWLFASVACYAQQMVEFDHYHVYYSAIPSRFLDEKMAEKYSFLRSKGLGIISITVARPSDGQEKQVLAQITGSVADQRDQRQALNFRLVTQDQYRYSLGQFHFREGALLTLKLAIYPQGEVKPLRVQFSQYMFNNP